MQRVKKSKLTGIPEAVLILRIGLEQFSSKIDGFPTTWEAYWEFARDDDEFGEYGPAGNQFGARTAFACGSSFFFAHGLPLGTTFGSPGVTLSAHGCAFLIGQRFPVLEWF